MNKKLLALAATGLLCATGVSAHDFEVDGIYYNIMSEEDKTVEVTYQGGAYTYYEEYSGAVNIPDTVTYDDQEYSVTSIGNHAFRDCYNLTSVGIPNGVIRIGDNAFYDCYNLTSVGIPNGVVSIGDAAFLNCEGLVSLIIPGSVTNIEDAAFRRCSGLNSIVVAIDNPVYDSREGCNAIIESASNTLVVGCESTTIPDGVTSIGDGAFADCDGLASVDIPNSVTNIGVHAFYDCKGLTSVDIPNSVTNIGYYAFYDCDGLASVTIPGSITTIETYTFYGCSNLTSVYIQDGVKSIDVNAFQKCEKLENVELPASVTSIGGSAFADCENLELIQVAPENEIYCSFNSNGIWGVYSKDMSELIAVPAGATGEFVIPETVKSVNYGACDGCKNLTSVVIPASVSHIGDYAFADCEGMTLITSNIPADKLFSISTYVFEMVNKANCFLNVPCGAQAIYAATEGWGGFKIIPYELTISDAGYATLYLDYTAQIPEGVSVYTANEVEGNLLKMEPVAGVLPANTGVVVKASAGTYTFTYSPEISDNLFKGSATYEYVDVASTQTAFVLSKVDGEVGMYPAKLTDGRFLNNANKAYLLITKLGVSDEELDTSVGGSQLSLRFDFGGTTGVDKVQTESGADAIIYDLYGRKVNKATTPGFYIINNKKVWVK